MGKNIFSDKYVGFKLETHMHTRQGSACASMSAQDQVAQYKEAGYDGVLVTDHFINGNSSVDRRLPWKDQMHRQFSGFRDAEEKGREIGLKVFCGIEYAYHGTEFIVIGLDEKWFAEHEEVTKMTPDEFLPYFKDAGAALIQAHPYRRESYIKEIRLFPELVDAVEVFNLGNKDDAWNDEAKELAKKYKKAETAGSDCHHKGKYGAGILLEKAPESTADLIEIIKSGKGWTHFGEEFKGEI